MEPMSGKEPITLEQHLDLVSQMRSWTGEEYQRRWTFSNGYGASVIRNGISYGNEQGLYELMVLKNGKPCYDSPVTDDVLGWLTPRQVAVRLKQIATIKGEKK